MSVSYKVWPLTINAGIAVEKTVIGYPPAYVSELGPRGRNGYVRQQEHHREAVKHATPSPFGGGRSSQGGREKVAETKSLDRSLPKKPPKKYKRREEEK